MTTTTYASHEPVVLRKLAGPSYYQPDLPMWAKERIRHTLEHVMSVRQWEGVEARMLAEHPKELAGLQAEWIAVWDALNDLLDPDYMTRTWKEAPQ